MNVAKRIPRFCGTYRVTRIGSSFYPEYAIVSITYNEREKLLQFCGKRYLKNSDGWDAFVDIAQATLHNISEEKNIRWDGSLVIESKSEGLFGDTRNNAQVFQHVKGGLIRKMYFSDTTYSHRYARIQ